MYLPYYIPYVYNSLGLVNVSMLEHLQSEVAKGPARAKKLKPM